MTLAGRHGDCYELLANGRAARCIVASGYEPSNDIALDVVKLLSDDCSCTYDPEDTLCYVLNKGVSYRPLTSKDPRVAQYEVERENA